MYPLVRSSVCHMSISRLLSHERLRSDGKFKLDKTVGR